MLFFAHSIQNDNADCQPVFPTPRPTLALDCRSSHYKLLTHDVPDCVFLIRLLISEVHPLRNRIKVVRRIRMDAIESGWQSFERPFRWRIMLDCEDVYIMTRADSTISANGCDKCTANDASTRVVNALGLCLNRDYALENMNPFAELVATLK